MQVSHTDALLNKIVVFCRQICHIILNGDAGLCLALQTELLQSFIISLYLKSVKNSPFRIYSCSKTMVEDIAFGCRGTTSTVS